MKQKEIKNSTSIKQAFVCYSSIKQPDAIISQKPVMYWYKIWGGGHITIQPGRKVRTIQCETLRTKTCKCSCAVCMCMKNGVVLSRGLCRRGAGVNRRDAPVKYGGDTMTARSSTCTIMCHLLMQCHKGL
jgi:hypothetical protein